MSITQPTKNLDYYLSLPLNHLETTNFITAYELSFDMKLGLYYLMEIYGLHFSTREHGTWSWIHIVKDENSDPLKADDILALEKDEEKYLKFKDDVSKGILPEAAKPSKPKKKYQPYGFLAPSGKFYPGEWGTHESEAFELILSQGFEDEYDAWSDPFHLARDFLILEKGYVLIHNPGNDGGYIVTYEKQLTKKQREFLYEYFCDIGDKLKGEMYLKGEEMK